MLHSSFLTKSHPLSILPVIGNVTDNVIGNGVLEIDSFLHGFFIEKEDKDGCND